MRTESCAQIARVTVAAAIRRADGRVEQLGTIAVGDRDPLRRAAWRAGRAARQAGRLTKNFARALGRVLTGG